MENSICITGIKRRPGDRGGRSDLDPGRVLIGLVIIFKSQLTSLVQTIFEKITSESSGI